MISDAAEEVVQSNKIDEHHATPMRNSGDAVLEPISEYPEHKRFVTYFLLDGEMNTTVDDETKEFYVFGSHLRVSRFDFIISPSKVRTQYLYVNGKYYQMLLFLYKNWILHYYLILICQI